MTNDNLGNTPQDNPDEWESWGGRNPRSYYVTEGIDYTTTAGHFQQPIFINSEGVLSFDDTVFQVVSGGVQRLSLTNIEDELDADPTADATNSVFEIPAGTYDFSLEFYGNQDPIASVFLGLYKITSGADDVEEFATTTWQKEFFGADDSDINAVYRVEEHDVVFDQAEKFYLQMGNVADIDTVDDNRIAGYFRIEKVR